ncbi:MAG: ATP-dependent Clp protease ATP-binding subunit [Bacteroidales bacterium]|nr:ATP-dependent Clp protease ATP-binding subunit [Bacteroidales bacterium]
MNSFSHEATEVLNFAVEEAERLGANSLTKEHVFLAILRLPDCNAMKLIRQYMIPYDAVKNYIEKQYNTTNTIDSLPPRRIERSIEFVSLQRIAYMEAMRMNSAEVGTEHLLLAFLKLVQQHDEWNQTFPQLREAYYQITNTRPEKKNEKQDDGEMMVVDLQDDENNQERREPQQCQLGDNKKDVNMFFGDEIFDPIDTDGVGNPNNVDTKESKTPTLDKYAKDLTRMAADGQLDPMIGREKELDRMIQILCRRRKNNPVLIGEPGVGKSAIVEGLAQRVVENKVCSLLNDKRIVQLDMMTLVAGTKYRGQFEDRIKSVVEELEENPNIILFIDEIHTIVAAGAAEGSMDAANLLKPSLSRGKIQCIGTTTLDEYRKKIEKDGALERRFQKVMVDANTKEETVEILTHLKTHYEHYHGVIYSDEALTACVNLTERYITDRSFPDKAIDALDEAGARAHMKNFVEPEEIGVLRKKISDTIAEKRQAEKKLDFERAAVLREKENMLKTDLENLRLTIKKQADKQRVVITEDDMALTVSLMAGVPLQRVSQAENERLAKMGDALNGSVVGQDEAINTVVKAIQRSRIGLKDPSKPIGNFIFLGPTGVGKTLLAKKLAEYLFGSQDALIRIDMSEYMEKINVSRLIGAAPGYVGYEEGGQLTEQVRRKPYSILLLDEIEKAHNDVFNLLLQVMDEGRLTDSLGRVVDFRNTVIIMTSNAGTRQLKDFGRGVGFALPDENTRFRERAVIEKALRKTFSPEFLNRVDDVVMFDSLQKEHILKIVDLEFAAVLKRTKTLGFELTLTNEAKHFLADKGYDQQFGARPLKRAIQTHVESVLTEYLLLHPSHPNILELTVDIDNATLKIIE